MFFISAEEIKKLIVYIGKIICQQIFQIAQARFPFDNILPPNYKFFVKNLFFSKKTLVCYEFMR